MLVKNHLNKYYRHIAAILPLLIITVLFFALFLYNNQTISLKETSRKLDKKNFDLAKQLERINSELKNLKSQDQYQINQALEKKIKDIENTYQLAATDYERLLDLKAISNKTDKFDDLFAKSLKLLSKHNYASAQAVLTDLSLQIDSEKSRIAAEFKPTENIPTNNNPPNSGYSRQSVQSDSGNFLVDIISADLATTRVIIDTASSSDCQDNCLALPLSDYVLRNGAYAAINGSYFCPSTYPTCTGKTNSFDLLVMNKNKTYFNSDNNVYSTNPAVIFGNGWIRFVGRALEWGRDTSIDGVLSNFPLLLQGNQIVYNGSNDPKFNSKGPRNFVANKGNTVYIGIIYNAAMDDSARVLKTMGMENAMNLDEGASTALWYGGAYKAGPGRNIPNAILFIRK